MLIINGTCSSHAIKEKQYLCQNKPFSHACLASWVPVFLESFEFQPSFFMFFSCFLCNEKILLNFGFFLPRFFKKICFFASHLLSNMLFCIKMQFPVSMHFLPVSNPSSAARLTFSFFIFSIRLRMISMPM